MDDKQFNELMTTLNRMADAMVGILLHLEPSLVVPIAEEATSQRVSDQSMVYLSSQSPIPSTTLEPTPWDKWQTARDAYGDGAIPANIMPAKGDDIGMIVLKTSALLAYTSWSEENRGIYFTAVKHHSYSVEEAQRLKMQVTAELLSLDPLEELVDVEAKTSTLTNLVLAERRKPRQVEPVESVSVSSSMPSAAQSAARTAMQTRTDILAAAARNANLRTMDETTRTRVFLALKAVAGEQNLHRIIGMLFGHVSFKAVSSAQAWALHQWLKPGQNDDRQWVPNYPHTVAEINNLLQHAVPASAGSAALEPISL